MNALDHRRRHWPLQIASVIVMVLVLVMMNLTFLGSSLFDRAVGQWGRGLEMTVYLKPDADGSAVTKMETMARASGDFDQVTFVTADGATKKFLKTLGPDAMTLLDDPTWRTPIPPTFELRLSDRIPARRRVGALRDWSARFRDAGLATEVFYGQGWIENFSRFIGGARTLFASLWLLASCVGLLIVGNCIRLSFQQRRDAIEIMELLGATPRFIRRPFLIEGLVLGLVASALSLPLSWGLHAGLLHWLENVGQAWFAGDLVSPMPFWSVVVNLASGAGFGLLGAWHCVRRLNTGWSATA